MSLRRFATMLCLVAPLMGCAEAATTPDATIRDRLVKVFPQLKVDSVKETPIAGLYEVNAKGFESVYASADGRYLIQGEMLEVRGAEIVNLSEEANREIYKTVLAAQKTSDMAVFPATGERKAIVYAFTDVDCGYCRKLHQELPAMNKMGVEVRYLAFPRTGINSKTAKTMEQIWCSPDRNYALTIAKRGEKVPVTANCKAPQIQAQYDLGGQLNVRGTPAMFDENGNQLGGYLSAQDLAKRLKLN